MAGPWEKYQDAPSDGPWAAYGSKDEPPKEKPITKGGSFRDTAANSMLFGFGDELAGATAATIAKLKGDPATFAQLYEGYRDNLRAKEEGYTKEQPWMSAGAKAVGALPSMLVGGGAANFVRGSGIVPTVGRAAVSGATTGTVSGAGNSTADNALGVGMDALEGGATGAALGSVFQGAGSAMGAGTRAAMNALGRPASTQSTAAEKVAEALARDRAGMPGNPANVAAARLNRLGPEARVVDAGGQNTLGLLDTVATLPGRTKQATEAAIRSRQAGRGDRMIQAADTATGAAGQRAAPVVQDLIQQRAQAAAPLYERLYKTDVPINPELASIIDAAKQLGATGLAKDIATGRRLPFSLADDAAAQSGSYRMSDLDQVKQALDTLIVKKGSTPDGAMTPLGASMNELRQALIGNLDKATNGAYAQARNAFAGPSALMDAVSAGRRVLTQDDASITAAMQSLSGSEQEFFRLGAMEALRQKLGTQGGQTQLINMWKEPATQDKLRALFGDERTFRSFAADVAKEGRMKGLERAGRGSQTASRQYGAGDLDVPAAAEAATTVMSGNPAGVMNMLGRAWNRTQMPEPVRDEIGRILLAQGRGGANELANINALAARIAARRNAMSIGTGAYTGDLGNLLAPQLLH